MVKTTTGGERSTWNFYDGNGNLTKVVSSTGHVERSEYSARDQLLATMIVNGLAETVVDENGKVDYPTTWEKSEEFDPEQSLVTHYQYNILEQVVGQISAQGIEPLPATRVSETHFETLSAFGVDWQLNPDYSVTSKYDALGRKRVVEQAIHGTPTKVYRNRMDYDLVGNVIREINPANQVTEYRYNSLYWVDAEITYKEPFSSEESWISVEPDQEVSAETALVTRYAYDAVGNKRQMIDPEGKETIYYYDGFNQLELVENELAEYIQYDYDEFGNKILEVDGGNKQKIFTYDKLQQLKTFLLLDILLKEGQT